MRCFSFVRLAAALCLVSSAEAASGQESHYADFNYGQNMADSMWVEAITVSEPACRSEVSGRVTVRFEAPGMARAEAFCWSAPDRRNPSPWGYDRNLTPKGIRLRDDGSGQFSFDASTLPYGPVNVRIYAEAEDGRRDIFELQLYNRGGKEWMQGVPSSGPAAAEGLTLLFEDDFDGELSISNDGRGARYNAHKPTFGDFSGWPFTDADSPDSPFEQVDTYLRIKARRAEGSRGSTGLIASVDMDGEGFWVRAPFYMECRFTAQSAPGTWPAFWTITNIHRGVGDELDIIEAYGGRGKGNPNYWGYSCTSHFWSQRGPDGKELKHPSQRVDMLSTGSCSSWSTTFHTYGLYVDAEDTVYYLDGIEVFRHPTNAVSRDSAHLFLVNYAIGGISGWPVNLERYGNGSDMWVDYVRVYGFPEKR